MDACALTLGLSLFAGISDVHARHGNELAALATLKDAGVQTHYVGGEKGIRVCFDAKNYHRELLSLLPAVKRLGQVDVEGANDVCEDIHLVAGCRRLVGLSFRDMELDGRLIGRLSQLREVRAINLNGVRGLNEDMFKEIARLPGLAGVSLFNCSTDGRGLRHLKDAKKLLLLSLSHCDLTDDSGEELVQLPLEILIATDCDVGDAFAEHLTKIRSLSHLSLSNTRLTDTGLAKLAEKPGKLSLSCGGTAVTDDFIRQLRATHPRLEIDRK